MNSEHEKKSIIIKLQSSMAMKKSLRVTGYLERKRCYQLLLFIKFMRTL